MKNILLLLIILLTGLSAEGQRTTRSRLRYKYPEVTQHADSALYVTLPVDSFTITGFDKPLNSLRETFHFSNHSGYTITELFITIDYSDTSSRQLHKRSRHIPQTITPGETTLISLPSFDRQRSFYYHLSRKPRVQATPFTVNISVDSVRVIVR